MLRFIGFALIGTGIALKGAITGYRWYYKKYVQPARISRFLGPFQKKMSYSEARHILDLKGITEPKQVNVAYKRIMKVNHPDIGGSPFLAEKINEARDLLLNDNDRQD